MERKNSMNAFSNPVVQLGQERKRLYSWSRPSLHRQARKSQAKAELSIQGRATMAFAPDGTWFKGNIISNTEDAYTISGRRVSVSHPRLGSVSELLEPLSHPDPVEHLGHSTSPATIASSPMSCSNTCSEDYSDSPSEIDSLDSELVRVAIESFSLEDEDSDGLYDITILDYETGINHSVKGVSGQISGESCSLLGESLSFRAGTVSKGAMADMVIQKNLGQALTERNMVVFQGELEFTYSDMICFPVAQGEGSGQWCL